MNKFQTELIYRKTATEGASGVGLVIALYDTLAGDMHRAAAAIRNKDIESRCKELNHAFLVLGYLEDWIDREQDKTFAATLSTFYAHLRGKFLEAQAKMSAQILEEQIELVLTVRRSWHQQLESAASSTRELPGSMPMNMPAGRGVWQEEPASLSWSA